MNQVNVGLCGLGTVGSGTFNVLARNAELIDGRVGRNIRITHVGARRLNPNCDTSGVKVSADIFAVADDPEIEVLVELIGGTSVAKELVIKALENRKHVVTANKALIAAHGNELFAIAQKHKVTISFEAAVAGGIPIISTLREGLAANSIEWLAGIINGTGNYILTEMRDKGRDFDEVLKEAQMLGYAEADPTFDVEGIDAAHKLVILASLAFGMPLQLEKVYTEGISLIKPDDVAYANELGYTIKHLGIARRKENNAIELRVHPTLIPNSRLVASVNGVMNAIVVKGDAVGPTLYYGPGAGSEATASAVIADIVRVARLSGERPDVQVPHLGFTQSALAEMDVLPIEECESAFYLRITTLDQPGVLSHVAHALSEAGISIEAFIQREPPEGQEHVAMILLTNRCVEKYIDRAIKEIESLAAVAGTVTRIRVESLK